MNNLYRISILISFFLLWISTFLTKEIETIVGFLFIFSFGILHGANDISIILGIRNYENNNFHFKIFIFYFMIIIIGVFTFYIFPFLSLILFIFVSGYHFGEQTWQNLDNSLSYNLKKKLYIVYGCFILFLLFYFHIAEVQNIIFEISKVSIQSKIFKIVLTFFGLLLLGLFSYLYFYYKSLRKNLLKEIFFFFLLAIIFRTGGLIWSFAIYFVLWHSVPSIIEQIRFLYLKVNYQTFFKYFKSALFYWIMSLLGILLIYFIFKNQKIFNALFFSFLAAVTFPHTYVISKMLSKKTKI